LDREIAIAYSKGIPIVQINSFYEKKFIQLMQEIVKKK